jgi:hypothetical protein
MITLSSDIVESITTATSQGIQQLWILIAVLLGIILSFYVLRKIIFLFTLVKR